MCEIDDHDNGITNKTVMKWYRTYNSVGHFKNIKKIKQRNNLPTILDSNTELKDAVLQFCNNNLATLSGELLHHYISEKCLPNLLSIRRKETNNPSMTTADVLRENQLCTFHPRTVNNWLTQLGYKYLPRKKTHYNDKHESVENVTYHHQFINRYFEYELLCHRWVQLPIAEYIQMKKEGEVFCGNGYKYQDNKGATYIKFHVDDSEKCTEIGNNMPFGGYLSVRKPKNEKPLIIFGQDECIYKQFIFRNKCWIGPNGESPLMPKDEGQGLMVSGFVCREYGFNWTLSDEELTKVNKYREDKDYIDVEAAKSKTGSSKKGKLKTSPFRRDLEYGANNEGYWTYDDMIMQVEDCIDCLKVVNEDKFQYMFLFDHLNGHDRSAPDALKADSIRKYYGGKQPSMRNSVIEDESFLGPHHHQSKLKVGQTQHMNFTQSDEGPFYLTPQQRHEHQHD